MEAVCAETRKLLAPYVRRPPLTDKLLARPPFRFLHDVIMEIMRATSFFDGLFVEEELVSDNVKDREKKIAFLQKIIDVINIVNGVKVSVKPTKVIAGQEPEKTNELLQQIGIALQNKATSSDAVEIVRNGKKAPVKTEKPKKVVAVKKSTKVIEAEKKPIVAKKQMKDKSTNKKPPEEKIEAEKKDAEKKSPKENEASLKSIDVFGDDVKDALPDKIDILDEDENISLPIVETPKDDKIDTPTPVPEIQEKPNDDLKILKPEAEAKIIENPLPKPEIQNQPSPDKAKSAMRRKKSVDNTEPKRNQSSRIVERTPLKTVENFQEQNDAAVQLKPPTVRPSSARPGAPRLKENSNVDVIINNAEPLTMGKVNIIVESYEKEKQEDDDGGTIVLESGLENTLNDENSGLIDSQKSDHGQLVKQIMETQKVLGNQDAIKNEADWKWDSQKDRDATHKEIETLRNRLQSMSKAANPLGKLIDFVREDVEVMRQELMHWRKLKKEVAISLTQQQSLTDQFVTQLQLKIKQMDDQINDQVKLVENVKSNIYRNSQKIKQLTGNE